MSIHSIWSVHPAKPYIPDAYLHSRTVIRRGQWFVLSAWGAPGSWRLETSTWYFILIGGI